VPSSEWNLIRLGVHSVRTDYGVFVLFDFDSIRRISLNFCVFADKSLVIRGSRI
jgi:hypothetical protein